MAFGFSHWRAGDLLAAWSAYWLGLAAVTLTPIALAIYRATQAGGPHGTAQVSASLGDAGVSITIKRLGTTVLERAASVPAIVFWVAVPPLVLWGVWLRARSRRLVREAEAAAAGAAAVPPALGEPDPARYERQRQRHHEDAR